MKIQNYNQGYKIVSLALDTDVKSDLEQDELDFLFIDDNQLLIYPGKNIVSSDIELIDKVRQYSNYDVFELWADGSLHLYFDNASIDNYFFVTGKCNSNCVMCPSPEISRKKGEKASAEQLIEIARHIPSNTPHLTITGGEPFMIGVSIFEFIEFLKQKFENTEFLFLTNGRIFAIEKYVKLLQNDIPFNSILAIPLHGSSPSVHDSITQTKNSFVQTKEGIRRLLANNIRVELRIVISKLNIDDFDAITNLIIREMKNITYVSIIAMEMTGNARKNKEKVWIPYKRVFNGVEQGIMNLISNGIDVKLYNFPLCTVDKMFWTLCEKSISPHKVKYDEKCNRCKMKKACGGVFAGTYALEREDLEPVL